MRVLGSQGFSLMECVIALAVISMGLAGILSVIPVVLRNVSDCEWKNRTGYLFQNLRADLRSRSGIVDEAGGWIDWSAMAERGSVQWQVDSGTLRTKRNGDWKVTMDRMEVDWWRVTVQGVGRSQMTYLYLPP